MSQSCLSQINVNSKSHERLVAQERQCWGNNQYSRHECLENTSVSDSVSNDDLEETTMKIFDKFDVVIDTSNIEDCHWLKSSGTKKVIIKFARRKGAKSDSEKQKQVKENESLLDWYQ